MAIASVLLYPNTLGGGAVFSGFLPFNSSIEDRISPQAKKVLFFLQCFKHVQINIIKTNKLKTWIKHQRKKHMKKERTSIQLFNQSLTIWNVNYYRHQFCGAMESLIPLCHLKLGKMGNTSCTKLAWLVNSRYSTIIN